MIDFIELQKIVPDKGTLNLTVRKNNGKLTVCYAPKHEGKEENKEFRPVVVTGAPEELNDEWNRTIPEIAKNERLLVTASASSNLSKRKRETERALVERAKSTSKTTKPTTTGNNSPDDNSLFTSAEKNESTKKDGNTEQKSSEENTSSENTQYSGSTSTSQKSSNQNSACDVPQKSSDGAQVSIF